MNSKDKKYSKYDKNNDHGHGYGSIIIAYNAYKN